MVISRFLAVSRRYLFAPICFAAVGLAHAVDNPGAAGAGVTNAAGAATSTATRPWRSSSQPAITTGGTTTGGTTTGGTTTGGTTTGGTAPGSYAPRNHGEANFVDRVGDRFAAFAGSEQNAESIALGLRNGTPITLTPGGTASGGTTTGGPSTGGTGTGGTGTGGAVTFTPPTGHMGHGNVTRALTIAQRQLASYGIDRPTPEQLKAALVGGTISTGSGSGARTVTADGVLTLRSQGMGWGRIEHATGIKHSGHGHYGIPPMGTGTPGQSGGVTTAGGTAPGRHHARHEGGEHEHEAEHRGRHGSRSGMVSASGSAAQAGRHDMRQEHRAGEAGHRSGGEHASRSGIVSASGGAATVSGRQDLRQEHRSGQAEAEHRSRNDHASSSSRSGIVSAGGAGVGAAAASHGQRGSRGATTVATAGTASVTASGAGISSASGSGVVSAGGAGGGHGRGGEHSGKGHK